MISKQGSQFRKTASHTAVYAIGTMIRRITGLVMLPIYTRYLTPADYGAVELLTMAIELAGILIGLRISQAMFRYYILADEGDKKQVVSTVLVTVLMSSVLGVILLLMASEPLTKAIFGSVDYLFEFRLFAFTLVANAVIAVGLSYIRARQMPVLFVSIGVASLVLQVCLNLIFVVYFELHVTGVVYSALIYGVIAATCLSLYVFMNVGFHYSRDLAARLIKYVAPLMLASVGAFYVAYADKYFLRVFSSLTEVGLYALAARVASVLATIFEAFNMSWGADRFEIVKKDNASDIYEQIFRFLNAGLILAGAGLALFADDFFRVLTSPEFYSASRIVPILILAYMFRMYEVYCNFGALYKDKTSILAKASWIKVPVAAIGYVVLIPHLGVYGAAITLAVSNFVELVWVHTQSVKLYDMGLRWKPVLLMMVVAITFVICGLTLPVGELRFFGLRVVLFILMLWIFIRMPFWKNDEIIMAKTFLRKIYRRRQ